jgi:predicted GNAT family acetyltransferase
VFVRTLGHGDIPALKQLLHQDPIAQCFVESRIDELGTALRQGFTEVVGCESHNGLESAAFLGANLVPIGTCSGARKVLAEWLGLRHRRCSSIVGPKHEVLDLWAQLESAWGPARDVRPEQPFLIRDQPPVIPSESQVRLATMADLDLVVPASVAMFIEEVGVSPYRGGGESLYRARIAEFIRRGRVFVWIDNGTVIFKAELGAVTPSACQVQGVWMNPTMRGQGRSAPAMAEVTRLALGLAPVVGLYVNDYNVAARRMYERVGYKEHTRFATVLF